MKPKGIFFAVLTLVVVVAMAFAWSRLRAESPTSVQEITARWELAGHADAESAAFARWDGDDPPLVPVACARCHSMNGYLNYLGADGTEAGVVDGPAKPAHVSCQTCHNTPAHARDTVTFPSGAEIRDLAAQATCMDCHQGRASTNSVQNAIADQPLDAVMEGQAFIAIHYAYAAATKYGADVRAGYQYADREYVGYYEHATQMETCVQCHDPHSTRIDPRTCSPCHSNVVTAADYRAIRMDGTDYDGDGNTTVGIAVEIAGLQRALLRALQAYAAEVSSTPIVYDADTNPFFFIDTNANGIADPDEVHRGNSYQAWTPRLLRMAYNYHFSRKDPGAFVHNPRYVLQLLYDSLDDAAQVVTVDMGSYSRP